jgi:hypothetical protein
MNLPAWVGWTIAGLVWVTWRLWAVNWKKTWPVLAEGGWVPLLLLMVMATLAWSRLQPQELWWQMSMVGGLVGLALFCGWLQGFFGWTPPEVSVGPPVHAGHDHGHEHDGHAH